MASLDQTTKLTAELALSPEALAKLKERANGHPLNEFLSSLLEAELRRVTIDELLAPVRAEFAASEMSEDELLALGRRELEALRRENDATSR